ncbi:hypothetical protein [Telluribacter humicola]|uniref:hypothetical protein n=1 Tax=Telluribacter humicola TaxID=1720261 RepID=UPI001A970CC6|nr:hypothetical protein [Telluribacter humicola]
MIKHTILWGLLLLGSTLAAPVHAQLSKGTRYWGGTITVQGTTGNEKQELKGGEARASTFTIQPELQFGIFSNSTTMLGIGSRYFLNPQTRRDLNSDYQYNYVNQSIALLPFIRKYRALNDRWLLFLHSELGVAYQWESVKDLWNANARNDWQYELGLKPGAVYYFPRTGWAIEGYANILSLTARYKPTSLDQQRFSLTTNFGTAAPNYITLRISRYSNPSSH